MFMAESPLRHLHSSSKLFSKFHSPFCSTHFIWYFELNLNCKIPLPTSTICRSEPIFHAIRRVFFNALKFWFLFAKSRLNRLSEHFSSKSDLHLDLMGISSSSSLVRRRLDRPSTTVLSMVVMGRKKELNSRKKPLLQKQEGEKARLEKTRGRKLLLGREKKKVHILVYSSFTFIFFL